jgi:hypothetical protein
VEGREGRIFLGRAWLYGGTGANFRSRHHTPEGTMMERILPRNQHSIERIMRIGLGVALLALVFVGPRTPWGYIGLVPLATGLLGSCPLYTVLGISTCRMKTTP